MTSSSLPTDAMLQVVKNEINRRDALGKFGADGQSEPLALQPLARAQSSESERHVSDFKAEIERLLADFPTSLVERPIIPNVSLREITLGALLAARGDIFVDNAYAAILQRTADQGARAYYLDSLANGRTSRIAILGALRYSQEGRHIGVRVPGLALRFAADRASNLPVVGVFVRLVKCLLGLPALTLSVERLADDQRTVQYSDRAATNRAIATLAQQTQRVAGQVYASDEARLELSHSLTTLLNTHAARINAMSHSSRDAERVQDRARQDFTRLFDAMEGVHYEISALHTSREQTLSSQVSMSDRVNELSTEILNQARWFNSLSSDLSASMVTLDASLRSMLKDSDESRERALASIHASTKDALSLADEQTAAALLQIKESVNVVVNSVQACKTALAESAQNGVDRLHSAQNEWRAQLDFLKSTLAAQDELRDQHLAATERQRGEQLQALTNQLQAVKIPMAQMQQLSETVAALDTFRNSVNSLPAAHDHLKRAVLDQERRVNLLLEETRKRLPALMEQDQLAAMAAEADHTLDAFYVSFEDQFRGTRADIKQRVGVYLPYIQQANVGDRSALVIDLGCGRGEWLELLRDNGFSAKGIDQNRVMVRQCLELELDVIDADVVEFLQNLQPNSVAAITGMHIIEHIPFRRLIDLFDAALRALKPGGIVIFETPNPENIQVGACNFYYDPTHIRPLPPDPIRFVVEARGFVDVQILRLHPVSETDNTDIALQKFLGPQDYSVIARKS